MDEACAAKELQGIFEGLDIRRGSTIYLSIDMARVPLPRWRVSFTKDQIRERENRWCAFLFNQIFDALGPLGTLLVGTFSYSCGNPKVPFVVETTPSEIGPFTNWLRQQPLAVRSLHPLFSVAGVGAHAHEILSGNGYSAFGPLSPFGRLAQFNTRFVCLGVPLSQSITYLHHLEQCYGSNHRYHKIIETHVIKDGRRMPGPFLAYLRWRTVDMESNFLPFERRLLDANVMQQIYWKDYVNHAVNVTDVDHLGYLMLSENPCAFASRNVYIELEEITTTEG